MKENCFKFKSIFESQSSILSDHLEKNICRTEPAIKPCKKLRIASYELCNGFGDQIDRDPTRAQYELNRIEIDRNQV